MLSALIPIVNYQPLSSLILAVDYQPLSALILALAFHVSVESNYLT